MLTHQNWDRQTLTRETRRIHYSHLTTYNPTTNRPDPIAQANILLEIPDTAIGDYNNSSAVERSNLETIREDHNWTITALEAIRVKRSWPPFLY